METAVISRAGPDVRIFPDRKALSHAAAELFRLLAGRAISNHGRFTSAISGGSTPVELYALLAQKPYSEKIEWELVHLFWADERCVPPEHEESNYGLAEKMLISRVAIPGENVHRIKGEESPDLAAASYDRDLKAFFGAYAFPFMDLVILGVGVDGHTASLFPRSPQLNERKRLAVPVFTDHKKDRVTLTLPVLNNSRHVLFLAAGLSKRNIVNSILVADNPDTLPAGLVRPVTGNCIWFLDQDAASDLPQR